MKSANISFLFFLLLLACKQYNPIKENGELAKNQAEPPYFLNLEHSMDEGKTVTLSMIGKELEYIPLETTNRSMLKMVQGIKLSKDYIFISDFYKLLQFDKNGKFIRQVGSNGRGPGEYIYVIDFCIDEERKRVSILAWGINAILGYDFVGKFVGKSSTLPFNSQQVLVNDSSGFVFHISDPPIDKMDSKNNLTFTDFEYNILFSIRRHFIRKSNYLIGRTSLYFSNGFLRFQQYGVDTLYTVKKEIMEPYAIFNLGRLKMDPNIIFPRPGSLKVVSKMLKEKLCINDILEDGEFIFTKLCFGISDSSKYFVFNKKHTETTLLENEGFENDIDGGMPFWPKYIYNDRILVDYCDANTFKNNASGKNNKKQAGNYGDKNIKLINLANRMDEFSNPVLIILKSH